MAVYAMNSIATTIICNTNYASKQEFIAHNSPAACIINSANHVHV